MHTLLLSTENITNGFKIEFIDFSTLVSILSAILVIISKNPIVSVLCLIGLFLSISCYLMTLGLNFIGLSYLLVYVGAVSILFLFILMLINVRVSELLSDASNSIPLAIIVGISFNYALYEILPYSVATLNRYSVNIKDSLLDIIYNSNNDYFNLFRIFQNKDEIVFVTSKTWDGSLAENSHITSIGNIMYTSYSMWLMLTSIILLLAMVGAIVITIKQKTNTIV